MNTEIEKLLKKEDLDADKDLCGFMLETFQGWGAIFYPIDYIQAMREWSVKNESLLDWDLKIKVAVHDEINDRDVLVPIDTILFIVFLIILFLAPLLPT